MVIKSGLLPAAHHNSLKYEISSIWNWGCIYRISFWVLAVRIKATATRKRNASPRGWQPRYKLSGLWTCMKCSNIRKLKNTNQKQLGVSYKKGHRVTMSGTDIVLGDDVITHHCSWCFHPTSEQLQKPWTAAHPVTISNYVWIHPDPMLAG